MITSFLGHTNIQVQIVHPVFCRISDIQKSGNPDNRKSGHPDFRKSGYPDIRKSEYREIRISGNPDIRISKEHDVEFLEASDAWHRRCQDPSEKQENLACRPAPLQSGHLSPMRRIVLMMHEGRFWTKLCSQHMTQCRFWMKLWRKVMTGTSKTVQTITIAQHPLQKFG